MEVKTEHFEFTVHITDRLHNERIISKYYLIGNEKKPCLSLIVYMPESPYPDEIISTANLMNIESLYECIDNEISEENMKSHSFGNELLGWVYTHIRDTYPYIKRMKLDDESYIPCNRLLNDTLDLMTYSIAHYKETWYEKNYKAYLLPEAVYTKYRTAVESYGTKEFKSSISWDTFFTVHFQSCTPYAYTQVSSNIDMYKTMYESSPTFPEFFRSLTSSVDSSNKCKLYKSWLQQFINSILPISRRWYIDIKPARGGNRKRINKSKRRTAKRIASR